MAMDNNQCSMVLLAWPLLPPLPATAPDVALPERSERKLQLLPPPLEKLVLKMTSMKQEDSREELLKQYCSPRKKERKERRATGKYIYIIAHLFYRANRLAEVIFF